MTTYIRPPYVTPGEWKRAQKRLGRMLVLMRRIRDHIGPDAPAFAQEVKQHCEQVLADPNPRLAVFVTRSRWPSEAGASASPTE